MTDYVAPSGVRIADADRVRLGAHLAAGTTVMHEGFCNFNAGTLGTSMVEGRIVAGRGRRRRLRHRRRLLDHGHAVGRRQGQGLASASAACSGANAGIGISLGDDCVVEAGCYITAGSKLTAAGRPRSSRPRELSGVNGLLFWRNSRDRRAGGPAPKGTGIELNAALHAN